MKESSSQIVCGAREKSRCPQGAAGSLPERRLVGRSGSSTHDGSGPGVPGGPRLRPHPLDLRQVECALVLAPWVATLDIDGQGATSPRTTWPLSKRVTTF